MELLLTLDQNDNCYCGGDYVEREYVCFYCDGIGGTCDNCKGTGDETLMTCNECGNQKI